MSQTKSRHLMEQETIKKMSKKKKEGSDGSMEKGRQRQHTPKPTKDKGEEGMYQEKRGG